MISNNLDPQIIQTGRWKCDEEKCEAEICCIRLHGRIVLHFWRDTAVRL